MRSFKTKLLLAGAALVCTWFMLPVHQAHSFSTGAPAGYCNAPANPGATCHFCHSSGPAPVTVPGLITSNIPATGYIPGTTYTITATVSAVGHNRFGFEISPQDPNGNLMGSMGDLGNETTFQQAGVYITHSSTSLLSNDSKTWQFEWTAPAAGSGNVTFYGAFNITNNDGAYTGDTIQLSTSSWAENTGLFVEPVATNAEIQSWIYDGVLNVKNPEAGKQELELVDYTGKICWRSSMDNSIPGMITQFSLPSSLATGTYVLRIESPRNSFYSKIILLQ